MKATLDIRGALNTIINSCVESADMSTRALIATLRAQHPELIVAARRQLEDLALTKIVNEVAIRRRGSRNAEQAELFGGYTGVPITIGFKSPDADGKQIFQRKTIEQVTIEELEAWLSDRTKSRAVTPDKFSGMRRMLRDVREAGLNKNVSIGEALAELARRGNNTA